jgi:hypothetical protein
MALSVVFAACRRPAAPRIENAAGFAGKYFVRCSVEPKRNVNRCYVYGKEDGKVVCARDFRLTVVDRNARKDELKFSSFDGENITLANGAKLTPLMACKAED